MKSKHSRIPRRYLGTILGGALLLAYLADENAFPSSEASEEGNASPNYF